MKKKLSFLATMVLAAGCAQNLELAEPTGEETPIATQPHMRSLENAVYNEVLDAWMIPQTDPYTLENFQKAYDNLATGRSTQALTRGQADKFTTGRKLKPTHYALRIYPRDEEEQFRVEKMDDVQTVYMPFDYAQLSLREIDRLPASKTRSTANAFIEKSPYTVAYNDYYTTDGGPTGPQTFQLPILYTVWPVDKPLPDDLEYVVDYEVFLPYPKSNESMSDEMQILLYEAIEYTMPEQVATRAYIGITEHNLPPFVLTVTTYDDELGCYVPLPDIDVTYQMGTLIQKGHMGTAGVWSFNPHSVFELSYPTISFNYHDMYDRWKMNFTRTFDNVEVDLPLPIGSGMATASIQMTSSACQENEIARAASYFFNSQSDFPKHYPPGGVHITLHDGVYQNNPYTRGSFHCPTGQTPWIDIYNIGDDNSTVIGTTLHELGHLVHYLNNPTDMLSTHLGLIESFAPYVGWYLGENYYKSLGWIKPPANFYFFSDITDNSQQYWLSTDIMGLHGEYTPLFIDLTDDYNQSEFNGSLAPNDEIEGVPPSVIWETITTCRTWSQCRAKLQSYVGTYYTATEFNNWISYFDYWFAQPYNN